jgi:hypothetical protein
LDGDKSSARPRLARGPVNLLNKLIGKVSWIIDEASKQAPANQGSTSAHQPVAQFVEKRSMHVQIRKPMGRSFVLNPIGSDQHQFLYTLRVGKSKSERDGTSLRKAHEADFFQVEQIQNLLQYSCIKINRIRENRPGTQSIAWQIRSEDTVLC